MVKDATPAQVLLGAVSGISLAPDAFSGPIPSTVVLMDNERDAYEKEGKTPSIVFVPAENKPIDLKTSSVQEKWLEISQKIAPIFTSLAKETATSTVHEYNLFDPREEILERKVTPIKYLGKVLSGDNVEAALARLAVSVEEQLIYGNPTDEESSAGWGREMQGLAWQAGEFEKEYKYKIVYDNAKDFADMAKARGMSTFYVYSSDKNGSNTALTEGSIATEIGLYKAVAIVPGAVVWAQLLPATYLPLATLPPFASRGMVLLYGALRVVDPRGFLLLKG